MRRRVTNQDLERFRSRQMSASELADLDANLREVGIEDGVDLPTVRALLHAARDDESDGLFSHETLLSYVQGTLDADEARAIDRLRAIDPELDGNVSAMESAARQVSASLQAAAFAQHPVKSKSRNLSLFLSWGLSAACLVVLAGVLPKTSVSQRRIHELELKVQNLSGLQNGAGERSVNALLRARPGERIVRTEESWALDTPISDRGLVTLQRGEFAVSERLKGEVAALASRQEGSAEMSPASTFVLPVVPMRFSWASSGGATVTVFDTSGKVVAGPQSVDGASWSLGRKLPPGVYSWTLAQGGTTTRRAFQVADDRTAAALVGELLAAGDALTRAVVLAENGYVDSAKGIIKDLAATSPDTPELANLLGHLEDLTKKE